jgi:hypothetical protein
MANQVKEVQSIRHLDLQLALGGHPTSIGLPTERRVATVRQCTDTESGLFRPRMARVDWRLGQWSMVFCHWTSHIRECHSGLPNETKVLLHDHNSTMDLHNWSIYPSSWSLRDRPLRQVRCLVLDTPRPE